MRWRTRRITASAEQFVGRDTGGVGFVENVENVGAFQEAGPAQVGQVADAADHLACVGDGGFGPQFVLPGFEFGDVGVVTGLPGLKVGEDTVGLDHVFLDRSGQLPEGGRQLPEFLVQHVLAYCFGDGRVVRHRAQDVGYGVHRRLLGRGRYAGWRGHGVLPVGSGYCITPTGPGGSGDPMAE